MMEPGTLIFSFIITSFALIYLFIKGRSLYMANGKIKEAIVRYYEDKGFIVNDVSALNMTERLRYGVPVLSIFRLYSFYFGFVTGKIDYIRKVYVTDKDDNEYAKYIELLVQGKDVISFKEFASYDF